MPFCSCTTQIPAPCSATGPAPACSRRTLSPEKMCDHPESHPWGNSAKSLGLNCIQRPIFLCTIPPILQICTQRTPGCDLQPCPRAQPMRSRTNKANRTNFLTSKCQTSVERLTALRCSLPYYVVCLTAPSTREVRRSTQHPSKRPTHLSWAVSMTKSQGNASMQRERDLGFNEDSHRKLQHIKNRTAEINQLQFVLKIRKCVVHQEHEYQSIAKLMIVGSRERVWR